MWVTVWRHGESGPGIPDRERTLTPRGEASVSSAVAVYAASLADRGIAPVTDIVASPWRRTEQTAALLGAVLGLEPGSDPRLAPGTSVSAIAGLLEQHPAHVLMVGHQPTVSELLWYWLDSTQLPPLAPGGWATVALDFPGRGMANLIDYRASIF